MAAPHRGCVRRIGPVPDRLDALLAAIGKASDADVIVTSGGASVGDHDLVRPALEAWGAKIDFWRVAMRPGKPLLVARRLPPAPNGGDGQWVLGLPGNPVSSYVTAFLFALPLLRKLGGARSFLPVPRELMLAAPLPAGESRLELVRARYDGRSVAPLAERDSSALRSLAAANALIRREIGAPPAVAGDTVTAYLLENGGIA
jgi:molybdopterin molybdotransferase